VTHSFPTRRSSDSRVDSIVRVEAHNLRKRLREYYAIEGIQDDLIIELPVGTYQPLFRPRPSASPAPGKPRRRRAALAAAAILTLAAAAGLVWLLRTPPERSLAVLPFKNLGGPDHEALALGITEDLTTQFARLPQLRVTSRTSATQVKAPSGDLRQLGQLLQVGAVLEGSVWREGDRVRFTAQLIDVASGYHKWSESFDRPAANALAAEEEVTRLIVAAVARSLGVSAAGAPAYIPSPEGRNLYWAARYLRQQATPESREKAQTLLEQAVAKDPQYIDAWAALANVSLARTFHQESPFVEASALTRRAAQRAVALDSGNTDGLVALAEMEWLRDRDWPAAERRLLLALARNPSSASARAWLATGLVAHSRFDDALKELERATAISPASYVVSNDIATALYCARRYPEAERQARRTLEVNPRFTYARILLGACAAAQNRLPEALKEFRAVAVAGDRDAVLARLGNALARAGERTEAEAILREIEQRITAGRDLHYDLAVIRLGFGDHAAALAALETALTRFETDINYIGVDPLFDPLRSDPRFLALRKTLGL
jgi:TolB-like protein/Tfp pilus assembly protein PilF